MIDSALAFAPAAFLAGILMFLAPCTLPLVPSYLAFIAGVPQKDIGKGGNTRRRLLTNAAAFVIGFSCIFIALGLFAGTLGSIAGEWRPYISRIAGAVIILFGLTMLGVVRLPILLAERRMKLPHFIAVGRKESSFLMGALFALAWTPCIGPVLGTVLLFASSSATAVQGALLLGVFSLGLAIPFLLTAFMLGSAGKAFARMRGAVEIVSKLAGLLLVAAGALMLFGYTGLMAQWLEALLAPLGLNSLLLYV